MKALHLHVGRPVKDVHQRSQGMIKSAQLRSGRQSECRRNSASAIGRRILAATIVLCLGLGLGSCTSFSGYVSDHWPHWAGGLPADAPPRPGAPGYDEFIAHSQANKDAAAPAVAGEKTGAPAAPASSRPADDQGVVQGGLY
jgi:hypothetical protein